MALKISRGVRRGAVRTVIYGPEGIGKTTLAAAWPDPIIIDAEDGSNALDVARVTALDWRAVEGAVKELAKDPQGFRTVVIDSIDWVEKSISEWMLSQNSKKSIEDYGYGKGYTILQEHVSRFLVLCDALIAGGLHVVLVAHSKTTRVSPPDQTDGFDRYELKLSKQVAPVVKEWADMLLFANFQLHIVEGTDGKVKAQGGRERKMFTCHTAAWDAKNRYGLPEAVDMHFNSIAHVIAGEVQAKPAEAPKEPAKDSAPQTMETPVEEAQQGTQEAPTCCSNEQASKLELYAKNSLCGPMIAKRLGELTYMEIAELSPDEATTLIKECQAAMNADANAPKTGTKQQPKQDVRGKFPAYIASWLEANEAKLDAYFVKVTWLQPGQSWRDLDAEQAEKVIARAVNLSKAAGVPAPAAGRAAA